MRALPRRLVASVGSSHREKLVDEHQVATGAQHLGAFDESGLLIRPVDNPAPAWFLAEGPPDVPVWTTTEPQRRQATGRVVSQCPVLTSRRGAWLP